MEQTMPRALVSKITIDIPKVLLNNPSAKLFIIRESSWSFLYFLFS